MPGQSRRGCNGVVVLPDHLIPDTLHAGSRSRSNRGGPRSEARNFRPGILTAHDNASAVLVKHFLLNLLLMYGQTIRKPPVTSRTAPTGRRSANCASEGCHRGYLRLLEAKVACHKPVTDASHNELLAALMHALSRAVLRQTRGSGSTPWRSGEALFKPMYFLYKGDP